MGQRVRLMKDKSERDKYGRLLRYVYVGKIFVNERLVKAGHARAKRYEPDVKYASLFERAEEKAIRKASGCWQHIAKGATGQFIGNRNSRKIHHENHEKCSASIGQMKAENKVVLDSFASGVNRGFSPCAECL